MNKIKFSSGLYGIMIVFYYMLLVYLFKKQVYIYPLFMITAFFFSMFLNFKKMVYSFLPLTLIFVIHLFLPSSVISTALIYVFFIPFIFILGFCLKNKHWILKLLIVLFLIIFPQFGFANLWSITKNYNARQSISLSKMEVYTSSGELKRLDLVDDKIIVLDYWNSTCGVCFKSFPKYEEIALSYKNNPKVEFYSLNIPIKRDTLGHAKKMIEKYNYKFSNLYAKSDSLSKAMGIKKYPHLVILKDGKIRFNGALLMDEKVKFFHLKNEVDRLLNE